MNNIHRLCSQSSNWARTIQTKQLNNIDSKAACMCTTMDAIQQKKKNLRKKKQIVHALQCIRNRDKCV